MKHFLIGICCLLSVLMQAQDTLYKRSGEIIPAKILEINIKEVSYKRSDLLEGPLFVILKNDIKKIRYATGTIDSFAIVAPAPPKQVVMRTPIYLPTNPNEITNTYRRGFYKFQGHQISDRNVMILAVEKNLLWKNTEIDRNVKEYRRNKAIQYSIGLGGAALGIAGLYGSAFILSYNSNYTSNMIAGGIGAAAFGGILVSSQIVSFQYKLKRLKNTNKMMELYNQLSQN